MISVFRWNCTAGTGGPHPVAELPATAAEVTGDDVLWIDLSDPTPEEEHRIFEQFFRVHSLTLEDMTFPRRNPTEGAHLPKVEEFPDYLFVIATPLPAGLAKQFAPGEKKPDDLSPSPGLSLKVRPQLSAVLTHKLLITHHTQPLDCITEVASHVGRHCETIRRGPDYLFHLILDSMVDEYAAVADRVTALLDGLERGVFKDPSPNQLARMLKLKRMISRLRKTLVLEREVLARLMRGEFELVNEREIAYYRNVYDHLVRYTELIESAREMVSDLMQTHLAAASNRLNKIMKFLTTISTIVLPMSLVAGIYGMNFKQMPELNWEYGYPFALALMAITGLGSLVLFRWRGWL
jgi:magnesium transporter